MLPHFTELQPDEVKKKRVLNFVQEVFFLLSMDGSLVITRAYQPYTLVGPPVRGLVLDP